MTIRRQVRVCVKKMFVAVLASLLCGSGALAAPVVSDGEDPLVLPGTKLIVVLPSGTRVNADFDGLSGLQWATLSGTDRLEHSSGLLTVDLIEHSCSAATKSTLANLPAGWLEIAPDEHGQARACWPGGSSNLVVILKQLDVAPLRELLLALATAVRAPVNVDFDALGLTFSLPADGFDWLAAEGSGGTFGIIKRMHPATPPVSMTVLFDPAPSCQALNARRELGLESKLENLPDDWQSGRLSLEWAAKHARTDTMACLDVGDRALTVYFSSEPNRIVDVAKYVPILRAIAAAASSVAPRSHEEPGVEDPSTPAGEWLPPSAPVSQSKRAMLFGWWSLEVPISWRDTPEGLKVSGDSAPALRVNFPGMEMGFVYADSVFVRLALAAAVDGIGALGGETTLSPRFGGQHLEANLDLGFSVAVGDETRIGLTAGWHGLAGPLTKNSSVAASAHYLWLINNYSALMARVTPVQLLASNERMFLSPLVFDIRYFISGLGFGLELQYIAAPEPGDEDLPAAGLAVLLRLGTGGAGLE